MPSSAVVSALSHLGGVARTRDLLRSGITKTELSASHRRGLVTRARVGVYALPETSSCVLESLSHRGIAACTSAARDHGLWVLGTAEHPHTWVDPAHHPVRVAMHTDVAARGCCVFHRDTAIGAHSLRAVSVVQCLRQMLGCLGEEAFFAALESALRRGLLNGDERENLRRAVSEEHRWLVDFARVNADSGLESLVRLRLHRHGLELASQVSIPGVGTVDFVLGDRLILEADGKTHDGEARHTDRVRDAVAMTLGYVTIRLDSAIILHDWPLAEAAILTAVARNLHRTAGRK